MYFLSVVSISIAEWGTGRQEHEQEHGFDIAILCGVSWIDA